MEYSIIKKSFKVDIEDEVNAKLKEGYELHGDLIVVLTSDGLTYIQAMTKATNHSQILTEQAIN